MKEAQSRLCSINPSDLLLMPELNHPGHFLPLPTLIATFLPTFKKDIAISFGIYFDTGSALHWGSMVWASSTFGALSQPMFSL